MKTPILEALIRHLEQELITLTESARAAHLAATHEESRAEDRHDTFAIEAGYLAQGQSERLLDLEETLREIRAYLESSGPNPNQVQLGTLVLIECAGRRTLSLITRSGGGTRVQVKVEAGVTSVALLSPASPLGEGLMGLQQDETFSLMSEAGEREYRVVSLS